MTNIEVSESSDGEIYTFIIKQIGANTVVDLTNYTAATMDIVSRDLKTNHGTITLAFGTKASGEITYTTDTADPWPTIGVAVPHVNVLGQIKITGSGLVTITEEIEIRVTKDYALIT